MSVQSRCGMMINKYIFCTQLSARLYHKFLNKNFNHQDKAIQIQKFCYFDHGINRTKTYFFGILGSCLFGVFANNSEWVGQKIKKSFTVDAAEILMGEDEEQKNTSVEQEKSDNEKKRVEFRDRLIRAYENRLRKHPDQKKIFNYFATVKLWNSQVSDIYMIPDDFLRAILPDMQQPDDLGINQYKEINVNDCLEVVKLDENSIFLKLGLAGFIWFEDYIFLLGVCLSPRRRFKQYFRDRDIGIEEFKKIFQELINQELNTNYTFEKINPDLATYFFGPNKDKKLSIEKFLDFHEQLQKELLSLEFESRNPDAGGKITEAAFAELLLAYAEYPEKQKIMILDRVKKQFKNNSQGISKNDYLKFFDFLNNIDDLYKKNMFYIATGEFISQDMFKNAARQVGHVELSDHVIQVVHTIFDENLDGQMSFWEFIDVMDRRLRRELTRQFDFKGKFSKFKDQFF